MAIPINPLPDLSQYNYVIGDTVDVVTKQNAINAEIEALGQNINATVASINTDVQAVEDAEQNLNAAQIVHAPGSGLANEAGTAYAEDAATLLDRVNHTGTQPLSTISDAGTAAASDVTTSATDTTAGRVITTDAGPSQAYKRANILGTVSQSGGVPTGAIIERGSNDDGEYVKYADGTLIHTSEDDINLTASVNQLSPSHPLMPNPIGQLTINMINSKWGDNTDRGVAIENFGFRFSGVDNISNYDVLTSLNGGVYTSIYASVFVIIHSRWF